MFESNSQLLDDSGSVFCVEWFVCVIENVLQRTSSDLVFLPEYLSVFDAAILFDGWIQYMFFEFDVRSGDLVELLGQFSC